MVVILTPKFCFFSPSLNPRANYGIDPSPKESGTEVFEPARFGSHMQVRVYWGLRPQSFRHSRSGFFIEPFSAVREVPGFFL